MESLPINLTDLVIIVILVASALFAFVRGLVHEMLSVTAWLGAIIATVFAWSHVVPYVRQLISIKIIADIAAGVGIFILVLVLLSILTHWFASRVRESSLGALDRTLGLLFGLLRGAVLVCIAWILVSLALPREEHPPWITEARALPLVEEGAYRLIALVPPGLIPALEALRRDSGPKSPEETFRELVKPEIGRESGGPAKGSGPAEGSGYNDRERKDMQRSIESVQ